MGFLFKKNKVMKNILVVYYTQTGQLKKIIDSLLKTIKKDENFNVDYLPIKTERKFNFPWNGYEFYDVMPECVLGKPVKIESDFAENKNYDLIVLAYQVWFLSPSIPFWSFLNDERTKKLLNNKNVITVLGVRNMWVNAHLRVVKKLKELNAKLVGNIVLADTNPNLVSVLTVLKYMTTGNKKPFKILPAYGVSDKNIEKISEIGVSIKEAILKNDYSNLQEKIVKNKGVYLKFHLLITELAAGKIFKKWANFINKKGGAMDMRRKTRLKIYKIYLLILIFVVSPVSSLLFILINLIFRPLTHKFVKKYYYL